MTRPIVATSFLVTGLVCGLAGWPLASLVALIYGAFLLIAWRAHLKGAPDQSEEG